MKEILDKTENDDEWKNAYTGSGGIPDDRCNPFTPDRAFHFRIKKDRKNIFLLMISKAVKVMRIAS